MKKTLYLFLILTGCQHEAIKTKIQSSCVYKQERIFSRDTGFYVWSPGSLEYGYAEAIKINQEWKASASASFWNDRIGIGFSTYYFYEERAINVEGLSITFYYNPKIRCYKITRNLPSDQSISEARAQYVSVNYDVLLNSYSVDENGDSNYLEIENIDLEEGKISGRFMVTFLRNSEETQFSYNLPVVRFFNGYFEADIEFLENE